MALKLYNTLTRRKEEFVPIHGSRVNMFVCGITPYDRTHLGHARTYVAFDVAARYLRYKGYSVFYLQNVTDIDDKIINRAKKLRSAEKEVAERYFKEYLRVMDSLDVNSVNLYAKATDYILEIIQQIQGLIEKGYAYVVDGNVYYEVKKFPDFGKLSGVKLEELQAGARVELDERKRNPEDFALWKSQKPGEPAWDSPWGKGRPGWHIEDTAVTVAHFGPCYDLHGGGNDLIFPHHEAEIAQAEAFTGLKPLVKYWLHSGFLNIKGERMGKSLGNIIAVEDVLKEYDPQVLRFFLLYTQYRKPIDFSPELLDEARRAYERLLNLRERLRSSLERVGEGDPKSNQRLLKACTEAKEMFERSMDDDFNTREAIAAIFDFGAEANLALDEGAGSQASAQALSMLDIFGPVLGLFQEEKAESGERGSVEALMNLILEIRERARHSKDYKMSDWIRERLRDLGITLEDTETGAKWKMR